MSDVEARHPFFDFRMSITGVASIGTLLYGIFFWGGKVDQKIDANNQALVEMVRAMREHGRLAAHPHQAAQTVAIQREVDRIDKRLGTVEARLIKVLSGQSGN